jgi:hypothetical protein
MIQRGEFDAARPASNASCCRTKKGRLRGPFDFFWLCERS